LSGNVIAENVSRKTLSTGISYIVDNTVTLITLQVLENVNYPTLVYQQLQIMYMLIQKTKKQLLLACGTLN
jgi:hypothetical protein